MDTGISLCNYAYVSIHRRKGKRMIRTSILLNHTELEGLKKLSATTGAPMAELIRRAINEYLQKKESFLATARAALQKKGV